MSVLCGTPGLSLVLQLIISGLGKIDIEDWKLNTRLKHCNPDSNVVKWFWAIVDSFDEEKRARLLQFVTGSSRVPLQVGCTAPLQPCPFGVGIVPSL